MPTPLASLLLQVIHQNPALPEPARLALLTSGDWAALTTAAIRYRLAFQFRDYLRTNPHIRLRVPEASLKRLDGAVRATLMVNLQRQGQLKQLLAACQTAGIPFMLMKGLWLVETIYQDLKARPSGDIDILLHPRDMSVFTGLARDLGFSVPPNILDLRDLAPAYHELMLIHPLSGTGLDVHWSLTRPIEETPVDEDRFWQRAESVWLGGSPCLCPNLEDHLLLTCFHAAIHHRFIFVGPRALLDVARILAQPPRPIDWDDFLQRSQEFGWNRGVWLTLDLVREYLGPHPPIGVLNSLRPDGAENPAVRRAAMEAIFLDQQHRKILGENVVRLINETSVRRRLALLLGRLFPSRREIASQFRVSLHQRGFHWYYLKHWQKLIRQATPRLIQLWAQDPRRRAELERSTIIAQWLQMK